MARASRVDWTFGGLHTSFAETKVPIDRCWSMSNCSVERGILEVRPGYSLFGERTGAHANDVGWGLAHGKYSNDELQTIVFGGVVSGGTFTLTWSGQTTAPIAYNATAAQVQAALEDLSNLLIGDVLVEGGPLPNAPLNVTFRGQFANTDVALITSTSSLTGTSPTITITEVVKGGTAEEYLAIVQKNGDSTATLYTVDPDTGVFTSVATNLHASDWYMVQYGNKIYGVNATQGMFAKVIGTSAGATTAFTRPSAPALQPQAQVGSTSGQFLSTVGLTFGNFVGWTTNPSTAVTGSGTVILTPTTALTANKELSFDFQWASDQDFDQNDVWFVTINSTKVMNLNGGQHLKTKVEFLDAVPNTIEPEIYGTNLTQQSGALGRYFHWQGKERAKRGVIRKIRVTFFIDVSLATSDSITVQFVRGYQWPNDTAPINVDNSPASRPIEYAYSYLDAATSLESDLSPVATTIPVPVGSNRLGGYVQLNGTVSGQLTGTDKIYIYRRERSSGKMRRLPNFDGTFGVANSGTPLYFDFYIESELAAFPEFGAGQVGLAASQIAGVAVQIATWKQTLVVGARRQAFISWIGRPQQFEPSPDQVVNTNADESQLDRGRTDYVSDNRAEPVYGLVGQDSLYGITSLSSYAMVGDSPAEAARFRRLPGSRGCVGSRAFEPFGGGIEVASQDGLWYYSVGRGFSGEDNGALVEREETADVRKSWEDLAAATGCVVVEHNDELWIWQGANYLHYTRSRRWNSGTFANSVKEAVGNRIRGLKFMDSRGRLYTISKAATTDAGVAIAWHYETGWLLSARAHVKAVWLRGNGTPTFKTYVADGLATVVSPVSNVKVSGKQRISNFSVQPGFQYKFRIEGASASDSIDALAIEVEDAPAGASL